MNMHLYKLVGIFASIAVFAACASQPMKEPAAGPEPTAGSTAGREQTTVTAEGEAMSIEEAREVVASIEASWPLSADNPLLNPTSLDDVEKILKLDQVRLFPAAIAYARSLGSVEALALHGQIELAWAEAYVILVEVIGNLDRLYSSTTEALEEKNLAHGLDDAETRRLAELTDASAKLRRAGRAFAALITEHMVNGSERAQKAIDQYPDSYLGYRVMADYHRLMQEWDAFEEMIAKIQERNPDSNGMRFLKGAAAFQKARDASAAAEFYRDALAKDPAFVRAQAHLMMIQTDPKALYSEYVKLKALNAEHQIVSWAAKGLERMYQDLEAGTPGS
jgi:hypothetical protein